MMIVRVRVRTKSNFDPFKLGLVSLCYFYRCVYGTMIANEQEVTYYILTTNIIKLR